MTSWYAVGVGLVVLVIAGVVGVLIPGLGQLGAVLLGGATAGYVVGGLRRGFWHGLLAGTIPGLAVAGAITVAVLIADFAFHPIGMLLGVIGLDSIGSLFTVSAYGILLALTFALFALTGGVGGVIGGGLKNV